MTDMDDIIYVPWSRYETYAGMLPAAAASSAGVGALANECAVVGAVGLCYLAWNFVCWQVRGAPPYPIQHRVGPGFYVGCLAVLMGAAYASHEARKVNQL